MAKHQYQRKYRQYTLFCEDEDNAILHLLQKISKSTMIGHSFDVVFDPSTTDEQVFPIDGDGRDKLISIKVAGIIKTYEFDDEDFKQKAKDIGDEA